MRRRVPQVPHRDGADDAAALNGDTPYTVMFGPDKCGGTNKVHVIFRHAAPDGTIEEKHLKSPPSVPFDRLPHLYTLVVRPDNTFEVKVDGETQSQGSLFDSFDPPFNPPEEIDDPDDSKPDDWVDAPKIDDPDAVKPEDWDEDAPMQIDDEDAVKPEGWLDDEPAEIEDPDAVKPDDWDDDEDGDWEAPLVPNPLCAKGPGCGEWVRPKKHNPDYKGKWYPPMIDNPEYKGPWAPRKIPNPKHFKDETPSPTSAPSAPSRWRSGPCPRASSSTTSSSPPTTSPPRSSRRPSGAPSTRL